MAEPYHGMTKTELLENLSYNPPDTPVWLNSQLELQRRLEERLTIWTRILAISTIVLATCSLLEVILTIVRH